jgi:RNA polymerase sigma-70 factor (ECF subfamily)
MEQPHDQTIGLIREARAGSSEALGRLFEGCRRYLLQVAGDDIDPRLQAKGGASDIVQETFLEAQRDFSAFKGDSEQELLAWLRLHLRYRLAKFGRSYRQTTKRAVGREVPIDGGGLPFSPGIPGADQPSPSEVAVGEENDRLLKRALERLPDEYRRVIQLRYRENLSFEQIGKALERTPNAARKLWARAIERLKRDLGRTTSA